MFKTDLAWRQALKLPVLFSAVIAVFFVFTTLLPQAVSIHMAVIPRDSDHLLGVLLHPFLHFSISHILSNVIGIIVLGGIISLYSSRYFVLVTMAGWLVGGLLLWLFSRGQSMVGGASGIVFAYLGFLMLYGFFARRWLPILISIVSIYLFYGSLIGLLPTQRAISWEGHLFGFVVGIACAWLFAKGRSRKP